MIKDIEFVCTANMDRSVFAEALLKQELRYRGIEKVVVNSSGTLADKLPVKLIYCVLMQKPHREKIIRENGLPELIYHEPKQTIVRPEAELIFALSPGNLKRVQAIYKNAGIMPEIKLMDGFAPISIALKEYEKMFKQIKTSVSKIIKEYF